MYCTFTPQHTPDIPPTDCSWLAGGRHQRGRPGDQPATAAGGGAVRPGAGWRGGTRGPGLRPPRRDPPTHDQWATHHDCTQWRRHSRQSRGASERGGRGGGTQLCPTAPVEQPLLPGVQRRGVPCRHSCRSPVARCSVARSPIPRYSAFTSHPFAPRTTHHAPRTTHHAPVARAVRLQVLADVWRCAGGDTGRVRPAGAGPADATLPAHVRLHRLLRGHDGAGAWRSVVGTAAVVACRVGCVRGRPCGLHGLCYLAAWAGAWLQSGAKLHRAAEPHVRRRPAPGHALRPSLLATGT